MSAEGTNNRNDFEAVAEVSDSDLQLMTPGERDELTSTLHLEEFLLRHGQGFHHYCLKLANHDSFLAEELYQESNVRCLHAMITKQCTVPLKAGFAMKVAKHVLKEFVRSSLRFRKQFQITVATGTLKNHEVQDHCNLIDLMCSLATLYRQYDERAKVGFTEEEKFVASIYMKELPVLAGERHCVSLLAELVKVELDKPSATFTMSETEIKSVCAKVRKQMQRAFKSLAKGTPWEHMT